MLCWELKCPAFAQSHFLPCSRINSPANTAWTPTFPPLAPLLSSQPSLHFLSCRDWLTHAVHEAVCDSTPNIPSNALPVFCRFADELSFPSSGGEWNSSLRLRLPQMSQDTWSSSWSWHVSSHVEVTCWLVTTARLWKTPWSRGLSLVHYCVLPRHRAQSLGPRRALNVWLT